MWYKPCSTTSRMGLMAMPAPLPANSRVGGGCAPRRALRAVVCTASLDLGVDFALWMRLCVGGPKGVRG